MNYTFQWERCDASGANCVDINGATASTYTLTSTDVGLTIRCRVSDGINTVTSASTVPVTGSAAQNSRWYSTTADVNTPIAAGHPTSPSNAAIMANFIPQGSNDFNKFYLGMRNREPVAYPTASTPNVTVQVNFPAVADHSVSVPIPAGTVLLPTNNENYLVVMLPNGDSWEFYDITKPGQTPYPQSAFGGTGGNATANANWQAAEATLNSPGWTGSGARPGGGGDSGLLEGYGAIRLLDTQTTAVGGNWGHAIGWTGFHNSNGTVTPRFVAPGTGPGDGTYSDAGAFPEGMRMQLDPSINIDTWPSMVGMPEYLKQMARTMQVYGIINVHGATSQGDGDGFRTEFSDNFPAGQRYPWQDPNTGAWPGPYDPSINLPPDLIPHFRVLDWTVPGPTVGAGIGAWRISSHDADLGEGVLQLGRYSVAVFNAWQATGGHLTPAQIHADNPNTKCFLYAAGPDIDMNSVTLQEEQDEAGSGVTMYDVTSTGHTDWILLDGAGNQLINRGYPFYFAGDIGSASFRTRWAQNVIARAQKFGFDGVSIDDILGSYLGYTGTSPPAKYPNQAAWQAAMVGFVAAVAPQLQAAGLIVAAEVFGWDDAGGIDNNNGSADAAWWAQVAPYLDILFCEYYEQNPNLLSQSYNSVDGDWTGNWPGWLGLVDVAQNAGKSFWGLNYSTGDSATDARLMRYGKASFLLKWNGRNYGAFFWQRRDGDSVATNPWDPTWTADIGQPTGAMSALGSCFFRQYTGGWVVANPTLTAQTVTVGGSSHMIPATDAIIHVGP